jgi:hypothetical protein
MNHLAVARSHSYPTEAIEGAAVADASGGHTGDAPAVMVRLLLLAPDPETGRQQVVRSLLKPIAMSPELACPGMTIALEILGEQRVFQAADILWDQERQTAIVEVEWTLAGAADAVERQSARRRSSPGRSLVP